MLERILHIPSCGISPVDQLTPGDTLLRCQAGLRLWIRGEFDYILCTGGRFLPPSTQTRAASLLMRDWFEENGVPRERVLVDVLSVDTYENVSISLDVLKLHGISEFEMTVCTQWAHAIRFWLTYRLGYGVTVHLHPMHYPMSPYSWLVEFVAFWLHLTDPRGERWMLSARNRVQRRRAARGK